MRLLVSMMLGVSALACRMDNPAFEGDELGGETADTLEVGEVDESAGDDATSESSGTNEGMDDIDGSSEVTSDDTSSTTDGDCTPGSPCGSCHVCDMEGVCVPDVGADCAESILHCSDYLFGAEEGTCHRLAETALIGSCDEQGQCKAPSPDICPMVKGEVHFACDPVCVNNPLGCTPLAAAVDVDMAAMCVVQGEGPGCHSMCSNQDNAAVVHQQCSFGECMSVFQELCFPFACNAENATCFEGCELPSECAEGLVCENSNCVMP